MPKFKVDVKAFVSVTVEAPDEDSARRAADEYVGTSCSPAPEEWAGWNAVQAEEGVSTVILDVGGFGVDGESDVEPEEGEA